MQRQQLVKLLIGVTGGQASSNAKGLLEQNVIDLRAITRKIALERPSLSRLHSGVELVEADLDDESSLQPLQVFQLFTATQLPQILPSPIYKKLQGQSELH